MSDQERAAQRNSRTFVEKIDGRTHPELFFRHELFDMLVSGVCPANPRAAAIRAPYGPSLRAMGLDDQAFWRRLSAAVGTYTPFDYCAPPGVSRRHERRVAVRVKFGSGDPVTVHVFREECRARYAAMQRVRKELGRTTLDRVLYGVIAPNQQMSYAGTEEHRIEELQFIESGCPER